jgi:hypothetical protein
VTGALVPAGIAVGIGTLLDGAVASGRLWAAIAVGATLLAAAADWTGVRPLALNRQVPSLWGHQHGPWLAALRYGPRLGLGPATILTSWTWWSALVCAAVVSPLIVLVTGGSYVVVRALSIIAVGSGVRDGVEMAKRMAKVTSTKRQHLVGTIALVTSVGGAIVVATLTFGAG